MGILNLDRIVSNVLGFDQKGLDQIRFIEWGKKYLWEVKFINISPTVVNTAFNDLGSFENFFPAMDVDDNTSNLESYQMEFYMDTYKVPQKSTIKDLKLTFLDDENNTLYKWIDDWINVDILNGGQYISAILDDHPIEVADSFGNGKGERIVSPLRAVELSKLSPARDRISSDIYFVYPESNIIYNGSSSSDLQTYTVPFVKVGGKLAKDQTTSKSLIDHARNILGRFI